jgi:hypothetical protein
VYSVKWLKMFPKTGFRAGTERAIRVLEISAFSTQSMGL